MYIPGFRAAFSNVFIHNCKRSNSNNNIDSSRLRLATVFAVVLFTVVRYCTFTRCDLFRFDLLSAVPGNVFALYHRLEYFFSKNANLLFLGSIPISHLQNPTQDGERTTRGGEQSTNRCQQTHISLCMWTGIRYNQRAVCTSEHFGRCGTYPHAFSSISLKYLNFNIDSLILGGSSHRWSK